MWVQECPGCHAITGISSKPVDGWAQDLVDDGVEECTCEHHQEGWFIMGSGVIFGSRNVKEFQRYETEYDARLAYARVLNTQKEALQGQMRDLRASLRNLARQNDKLEADIASETARLWAIRQEAK